MKKNINIAYLNGAEGMIRRGGASSGNGSDSGGSGESEDDVFDIQYIDLRGISNKRARMIISCYSNFQVYYNRLQSKVVTGCIATNTLSPLNTDDFAFHSTYTMACKLDMRMIIEDNVTLKDAILNAFDVDIEMLPKLAKEEFLNLGADDYSNWIYNHDNQSFYD